MSREPLAALIERHRGIIEHEYGDFTVRFLDDASAELLATAGYDWIEEGGVIAIARLSDRHADARLVIEQV